MKTRLFLALFFTCCSQILFAQTEKDETNAVTPKQEKPEQEKPDENKKPADPPKKEAKSKNSVKAVPLAKERKSKPARVSGSRPAGARPAKKARPATRPVKPGNGRR